MPYVEYECIVGNTNRDLKTGNTITEYFWRTSEAPPAGAQVVSATLSVTSFKTYTNRGVYLTLGPYGSTGSFAYNEATHSETVAVSINSSILNFANGSITLTVNTSQSSSGNQINFRDGCMIYLTVQYSGGSSASPSMGSLNKSSVEVGGSISLTVNASSSAYMHQAIWVCGPYSTTHELYAGVA